MQLKFGITPPSNLWQKTLCEKQAILNDISTAGFDHIYLADHVSFRDGSGTDGFVGVAGLSQLHDTLGVMISIYLLPLRHPLPVARQLATMHQLAPGRMLFGIGVGGEDRHEIEICGIDPRTRGKRTNESLRIIKDLLDGQEVTVDGSFQTRKRQDQTGRVAVHPNHHRRSLRCRPQPSSALWGRLDRRMVLTRAFRTSCRFDSTNRANM